MTDHTPEPWNFEGDIVSGPPLPHAHDPQAQYYDPASVVAILPANYGGAYRYYSPAQRDVNGRTVAAAPAMLRVTRMVAGLLEDPAALQGTDLAVIATLCRDLLQRHAIASTTATPGRDAGYTFDGEPITLDAFLAANPDLDTAEVHAALALRPGMEMRFGGGASAVTVLQRELPAGEPDEGASAPAHPTP